MDFLKSLIVFLFILLITPVAYAKTNLLNFVVPFQNVSLNPSVKLVANFSFGPFVMIFCFANDFASVVSITWPFNGKIFAGTLPILLKTNANFEGQFSDPNGILTLTNTPNNGVAQVSCVFGY